MKWLRLFYSIYWIQRISYCFSLFLSLKKALSCRQSNRMVIEVFQWNEIFLIVYRRIFLSRFLFRFHFYYCCKLFFFLPRFGYQCLLTRLCHGFQSYKLYYVVNIVGFSELAAKCCCWGRHHVCCCWCEWSLLLYSKYSLLLFRV